MERNIIEFKSDTEEQHLIRMGPLKKYASDTVNYIEARFNLSEIWHQFESLAAVWYVDNITKSSMIDENGATVIPQEVLTAPGILHMNLCASTVRNNVVVARVTSYPIDVLKLIKTKV